MNQESGKDIKDMTEEELLGLQKRLYDQVKDFSVSENATVPIIKKLRSIKLRLSKIS
jgi:hypothetical protein